MNSLRPSGKIGVVLAGFAGAIAVAWASILLRQIFANGPSAAASSGMTAFGDLLFGVAVFVLAALFPFTMALYWLRAVGRFWSTLVWSALAFASSGVLAVAALAASQPGTSGWMLVAQFRVGLMPLNALALATCSLFAPQTRHRWLLLAAAFVDGAIFTGVVLVKYVLPSLRAE